MGKKKKKSDLESELPDKKRKKSSIIDQLKDYIHPPAKTAMQKAPITFNVGLAIILFFFYLSIMIVGGISQPIIFLLILPTLYIIVRYIKLEREQSAAKQQSH